MTRMLFNHMLLLFPLFQRRAFFNLTGMQRNQVDFMQFGTLKMIFMEQVFYCDIEVK